MVHALCHQPQFYGVRATELFIETRHKKHTETGRQNYRHTHKARRGRETHRNRETHKDRDKKRPDPYKTTAGYAKWVTGDPPRSPHLWIRPGDGEVRF